MLHRQGENLRSIYVLLFLNVAFFFLEMKDGQRYAQLFAFERSRVLGGEVWRLLTYQFIQGNALSLFFTLLILYIIGGAVEEEWGTFHFLAFCLISTIGSAAVGALLNTALLGSFVFSYSLLFVYATIYPAQVFYIFFVIPVRVRWLAYLAIGFLVVMAVLGRPASIAALGGAALSYGYFLLHTRLHPRRRLPRGFTTHVEPAADASAGAGRNLERFRRIKEAIASAEPEAVDRLIEKTTREIVPGVNICPPVDFKPENEDGYCVRCEGFAECSVRYMKRQRETGTQSQTRAATAGS